MILFSANSDRIFSLTSINSTGSIKAAQCDTQCCILLQFANKLCEYLSK